MSVVVGIAKPSRARHSDGADSADEAKRRLKRRAARRRLVTPPLLGALVLLLATGLAAWWLHSRGSAPIRYSTAPAATGTVAPFVTASGTVNPVTTVQVGTYVSGVIQELHCDFNTQVRKGQLCAKIDPRPYQTIVDQDAAALATARAQLDKDRANLDFSQTALNRNRTLLDRKLVSQETFDTANNALRQARAQVELDTATISQRQAALDAAKVNLGYTDIVSPVDGTVVSRNVTQGQTVAASFQTPTLFVIAADLTKMQVDTNVSESDIGAVHVGDDTSFTVEAFPEREFHGKVVQVRQSPQSVQNVVTYDVVSDVPNPELLLKPGMTAAVHLVTERHEGVLSVPEQALRYTPTNESSSEESANPGAHVWVLRDGRPVEVAVKVGLNDDTNAEILGGTLEPGDRVIVGEQGPGDNRRLASRSAPPTRGFRL